MAGAAHLATQRRRQQLHTIANAEQRFPAGNQEGRQLRRAFVVYAVGPAGENIARGLPPLDARFRAVVRIHLGINAEFAHAPGDQLRVLRSEIYNGDAVKLELFHRQS